MEQREYEVTSYMTLEYKFSGVRIIEDSIIPSEWKLDVVLLGPPAPDVAAAQVLDNDASIAYQRLHFWLDLNMPDIVITDVANEYGMFVANASSNVMMYCPGEASDNLIVRMLHAKIATLCNNKLMVVTTRLKATDVSASYTFAPTEGNYGLPLSTSEMFTQEVMHDIPWWFRDDGYTFEFVKPTGVEDTFEELFGDVPDPMADFVPEEDYESEHAEAPVTKWKPRKI